MSWAGLPDDAKTQSSVSSVPLLHSFLKAAKQSCKRCIKVVASQGLTGAFVWSCITVTGAADIKLISWGIQQTYAQKSIGRSASPIVPTAPASATKDRVSIATSTTQIVVADKVYQLNLVNPEMKIKDVRPTPLYDNLPTYNDQQLLTYNNTQAQQILSIVNSAILGYAQKLQKERVKYDLHDTNGGVNCSTFVAHAIEKAIFVLNKSEGNIYPISSLEEKLNGTSENQILLFNGVSEATKLKYFDSTDILAASHNNNLQPGMLIGLAFNSLHEDYANGRTNGISHIGVVVINRQGQVSIADSSSGGDGIKVTEIQQWVSKINSYDPKGARFYLAQPFKDTKLKDGYAVEVAFNDAPEAPHQKIDPHFKAASSEQTHHRVPFIHRHSHHHSLYRYAYFNIAHARHI